MPWGKECFPRVRRGHKLPVVLSAEEVARFLSHVASIKYRAALMICYGSGLRISETIALRVSDIDSRRMLLRVREGKGRKDRYSLLSPGLLAVLRSYYRAARPRDYLFPSWREGRHITAGTLAGACTLAAKQSGIGKRITAHTLRHSFATHLLENGKDTSVIQALLGHKRIDTTARYTRVCRKKSQPRLRRSTGLLEPRWRGRPRKPQPPVKPCRGPLSNWPIFFDSTAKLTVSLTHCRCSGCASCGPSNVPYLRARRACRKCGQCDITRLSYNSCRNRHCPKCQNGGTGEMAAQQEGRTVAGGIFSRRLHHPGKDRPHRFS